MRRKSNKKNGIYNYVLIKNHLCGKTPHLEKSNPPPF